MDSGQRAIVTGIHRLQHVQGFSTTTLANDDPIRTHTQAVLDQVTNGHGSLALNIWRPSFKSDGVGLSQSQFGGIFYRNDSFAMRNIVGKHVQKSSLATARTTRNDNIFTIVNANFQKTHHGLGNRAEPYQIITDQFLFGKLPDGKARALGGKGGG